MKIQILLKDNTSGEYDVHSPGWLHTQLASPAPYLVLQQTNYTIILFKDTIKYITYT